MVMWRGDVVRVEVDAVYVEVAALGAGNEFRCQVGHGTYVVGNRVVVGSIDGISDDIVVIAVLDETSTPVPPTPVLDDLADVVITSAADENVLQYSGSLSKWVNRSTIALTNSAAGDDAFSVKVTGDTQRRFIVNADGKLEWGSGSTTQDVNLYRGTAKLMTDNHIIVASNAKGFRTTGAGGTPTAAYHSDRANATDHAFKSEVTGDSNPRYTVQADGKILWGAGGGSAQDTNLYRSAANRLQTDDEFWVNAAASSTSAFVAQVTGDSTARLVVLADGKIEWGPGNASRDVNLYRSAANVLKTDDTLEVLQLSSIRGSATDGAVTTRVTGDANDRLNVQADGKLTWGSGSATGDTNLYRSAANVLKTDDSHEVAGYGTRANEAYGDVSLTAPGGGGIVSSTVTYSTLAGAGTIHGFATANTSVPGSTVLGVSVGTPSSTSMLVYMNRTTTTATTVYWHVYRNAT